MSLPQSQARYTIAEYLAQERASEERHEFLDGQIYQMAGESGEHAESSSVEMIEQGRIELRLVVRLGWMLTNGVEHTSQVGQSWAIELE